MKEDVFKMSDLESGLRKKRSFDLYLTYTGLFAVTAVLVFLPFIVCGKSFIWTESPSDGLYQHLNAFTYIGKYLRRIVSVLFTEHRFVLPMWDFSIGYGADVLTTLAYYGFGDPFTLLAAFFTPSTAEVGYNIVIVLRMWCAGLAFCAWSRKMGASKTGTLCGALAYVFCGFALNASVKHFIFSGPMIWLPLVYLGVEKVFRKERPIALCLAVFAAAIGNFYFFYMIVIMTVLYVLVRGVSAADGKIRTYFLNILRIAAASVIGFLMACFVIVPVISAFLSSSRGDSTYVHDLFYTLKEYSAMPGTLITYKQSTLWAFPGVSPIAVVAVFSELSFKKKEKWGKVLTCVYFLFMLFPFFGYALNGFGYVTNRWIFAYSLFACFLLSKNLESLLSMKPTRKLILSAVCMLYAAVSIILQGSRTENVMVCMAILLSCLIFFCNADAIRSALARKLRPVYVKRTIQCAVIGLTLCGILVNAFYRFAPVESSRVSEFADAGSAMEQLEGGDGRVLSLIGDDGGFYRVDNGTYGFINRNYAIHKGIRSTSLYWSIVPESLSDYFENQQAYQQMKDMYRGLQSRTLLMPFASVKYFISRASAVSQTPYGFTKAGEFETETGEKRALYSTENYLPLGYTGDRYIYHSEYLAMTPTQRQQAMLEAVVIPDGTVADGSSLRHADVTFADYEIPFSFGESNGVEVGTGELTVKKADATVNLTMDCPPGVELYLYIEGLDFEPRSPQSLESAGNAENKSAFDRIVADNRAKYEDEATETVIRASSQGWVYSWVRHFTDKNIYAHGRHDYLLNLFYAETRGNTVTVTLTEPGIYRYDKISLIVQPLDGFEESVAALREDSLVNEKILTNRIEGDISLKTEKILCFSVPYSDGWSVSVDGRSAELLRANDMYMGVDLGPGDHHVVLSYTTPRLVTGVRMSAVGLAAFAASLAVVAGKARGGKRKGENALRRV